MQDSEFVNKLLKISGFEKLNPVQSDALAAGILENNIVISAPTASGKTFACELAAINCILQKGKKVVYIVPLKALASEKYHEFKKKYENLGVKVAISIGDLDSSDSWLEKYDIIICTSEKLDSLLRHGIAWVDKTGLIIADEIHLIGDFERGPTLEILLTKLRKFTKAQIIALSATIQNCREIADWLDAKLVESDYRPVKLFEGVFSENKIRFFGKDGSEIQNSRDIAADALLAENTVQNRKQALIFVSTRRAAEAAAERSGEAIGSYLSNEERMRLEKLSNDVLDALENPTKQCARLAACIKNGTAFHHAGLVAKQRDLVEKNFKTGLIKAITATPTLAQGINLPAFRVVIRDAKRYYPVIGYEYIPVLDYQQMVGRAGRPQYDEYGESLLIARNLDEAEELVERYVMGEPEEIHSKLASEPVLRMHVLSLIATQTCMSLDSLTDFFGRTLYGFQYGSPPDFADKLLDMLELLKNYKFIDASGKKLRATVIGKRVSELYIDPRTAYNFIEGLRIAYGQAKNTEDTLPFIDFSLLELMCNAAEMRPLLPVKSGEFRTLMQNIAESEKYLLHQIPDEFDYEYDEFLKSFKTALVFDDWVNEFTEEQILEKYRLTPGELYSKIAILDWLLYSCHELALLLGMKEILKYVRKLRMRVYYGIKDELVKLVRLRDIGRVRARRLWNAGFRDAESLRKAPEQTIAFLIGPAAARSVKEQLSGKVDEKKIEAKGLTEFTDS